MHKDNDMNSWRILDIICMPSRKMPDGELKIQLIQNAPEEMEIKIDVNIQFIPDDYNETDQKKDVEEDNNL